MVTPKAEPSKKSTLEEIECYVVKRLSINQRWEETCSVTGRFQSASWTYQEVCDPLTGGAGTVSWDSLQPWTSGMTALNAGLKSTKRSLHMSLGSRLASGCTVIPSVSLMLMIHPPGLVAQ